MKVVMEVVTNGCSYTIAHFFICYYVSINIL